MTALPDPSREPVDLLLETFRIVADENPAGILVHRRHVPLYVNAAWAASHGCTVAEVMAMPDLLGFTAPYERERMQRYTRERMSGREAPKRFSYQARHIDGSHMWVDALSRPVVWQGEPAVLNTVIQVDLERDATRIEAVERVNRDHELYLTVLSQVQDRISIISRDMTYRFTNQRNLDFYRLEPEQIIGHHMRDIIGEQRFATALPMFERCLHGEEINYQHGQDVPGGGSGWVDVSLRPFRPRDDTIEGVVVTLRDITDLHEAQESTRASETRLRSMITNMPGAVFLKDRKGRYQIINRAFEKYLSGRNADIIGRTVSDLVNATESSLATAHDQRVIRERTASEREREIVVDGEPRTVITSKFPVFDDAGKVSGVGGMELDITERKRTERALVESERRLFTLMSNLPGMAYRNRMFGDRVVTEFVSEGCKSLIGYEPAEVCGTEGFMAGITHPDDLSEVHETVARACRENARFEMRYRIITADGDLRWVWEQGHITLQGDEDLLVEGFITDISESQHLAERLSHQALHDPLTDLFNRRAFEEQLQAAVLAAQTGGEGSALVYLDLDRFKAVNDACGHAAGDELLRRLTTRMRRAIRRQDRLARLGGDEFGLLMERRDTEQAQRVAENLLRTIQDFRFRWEEEVFTVGASIGLVPITRETESASQVLVAADNACYVAKDSGRNRIRVYQHGDREVGELSGQSVWVSRVQDALERDRFVLHAQPIVALANEQPEFTHAEVLIRMQDENGVLISPSAFLPAAERYGLSTSIDRWVVTQVFDHLAGESAYTRLSVNLSARTLNDEGFLEFVCTALDANGIEPTRLCFEVTETAAIANIEAATTFIDTLRSRGCLFSLDDFGSGLSSFAYLKTLPVDFLKIDGQFVRDIARDPIDLALVRSIHDIGKVMGKQTIAEFVENTAILNLLREIGVDHAQGYGIARPRPLGGAN